MSAVVKWIMHGLASGRVRSTPEIFEVLKELNLRSPLSVRDKELLNRLAPRFSRSRNQSDH